MKTYFLELFIADNGEISSHEKTSEGFTAQEIRSVVSFLEETKLRLLFEIMNRQKEFDRKKQTKQ